MPGSESGIPTTEDHPARSVGYPAGHDVAALAVEGASRTYPGRRGHEPVRALIDARFEVRPGQRAALLGPNGAGKSTLMRMIATLERPDEGRLTVFGADVVRDAVRVRAMLGVVFQRAAVDPLLTVRENLRLQASLGGISRAEADRRISALLEEMGLADRQSQRAGALSGGLARRVDLVRALVLEPKLLMLDEPTTGLDPQSRMQFLDVLDRCSERYGLTILMSTHLIEEAQDIDLVVMMSEGRIVACDSPELLTAEMGRRILRTDEAHEAFLTGHGLEVRSSQGRLLATGADDDITRAMSALASRDVEFTYGRATLGDVYFARTGGMLGAPAGGADA